MLAIVIPYYKLTYFEATLESLANQTDKRFRVYIGDDTSPEDPKELLEKYNEKLDFFYKRFKENLGGISLVKQWERCIALTSEEEWLMILGDDDYLGETVISSWYENYNQFYKESTVIRYSSKIVYEESNMVTASYKHPLWESATDAYWRKFLHETRSSMSEYVFARQAFNKHHFYNYPLAWHSDDRAWIDFSDNKPIYTINKSIVYVRISAMNISGKIDNVNEKKASQMLFYKYIIAKKLHYYTKKQRLYFLLKYENEILVDGKSAISEWLYLLFYYTKHFEYVAFKKFIKNFLNALSPS